MNAFINKLETGDSIQLDITSYGGSVTAGLAICNLLKQASANGHKTTAHVIGIAASMASVIACSCDELEIDSNALFMMHLPWTSLMGNAIDLRKEADTLDKYCDALIAIYRTKFNMDDAAIRALLEDETWIVGNDAPALGMKCKVIQTEEPLRAAAFAHSKMPKFMKTPKVLEQIIKEMKMEEQTQENIEQIETALEETEKTVEVVDQTASVENADVNDETLAIENAAVENETMIPLAEAEKRVAGMQSTMAKKLDALKKEYDAKIEEFKVQMKAKDEELAKAKADATSFRESLEKSAEELSNVTSALEEKKNALETLNALVNTPAEEDVPTFSEGVKACKSPKEVLEFIKAGKYKKH